MTNKQILLLVCNCPLCTKIPMKKDEVYKCQKTGSYVGISPPSTDFLSPSPMQMKKLMIGYIDNEKNN